MFNVAVMHHLHSCQMLALSMILSWFTFLLERISGAEQRLAQMHVDKHILQVNGHSGAKRILHKFCISLNVDYVYKMCVVPVI